MGRLDDRVAIVTGGAGGIGRAIVEAFAGDGAQVFIVDRDGERGAATAASVVASGGRVNALEGDIRSEARVGEIVTDVLAAAGRIDILVNNAAIQREALLVDQTLDDFRAVVDTNLLGTFLFSRGVLPSMLGRGSGVIINLSSVLGLVGDAMLPIYSATKHAIIGLTRSTAVAYAGRGIRCVAICPGDVDTDLNRQYFESQPDPAGFRARIEHEYPGRRMAQPAEIAAVATFLASDDASFINGTYILADGGILSRMFDLYEGLP